jgi:hypothetical protein
MKLAAHKQMKEIVISDFMLSLVQWCQCQGIQQALGHGFSSGGIIRFISDVHKVYLMEILPGNAFPVQIYDPVEGKVPDLDFQGI